MGGALRAHDPTHHPMVVISNSAPGNEVFQIIHDLSGNCNIDSKEFYWFKTKTKTKPRTDILIISLLRIQTEKPNWDTSTDKLKLNEKGR